jgi:hypothetical protein
MEAWQVRFAVPDRHRERDVISEYELEESRRGLFAQALFAQALSICRVST